MQELDFNLWASLRGIRLAIRGRAWAVIIALVLMTALAVLVVYMLPKIMAVI